MKTFQRSRYNKKWLGIIGGVVDTFNWSVDANVVRLIFVLASLFFPVLILVYLVAGFIFPLEAKRY